MKSTERAHQTVENLIGGDVRTGQDAGQMITYDSRCETRTGSAPDFVDITDEIAAAVTRSEVDRGRAIVFASDDSCSIMVNERESGLLEDLKRTMERLGPRPGEPSRPLVGSSSIVLPIHQGKLQLGTWQRVLLVELSGSGSRMVDIQVIGER